MILTTAEDKQAKRREYQKRWHEATKERRKAADTPERKAARSAANKLYRERNAETINAQRSEYRKENRGLIRAMCNERYRSNPTNYVLLNIRTRAKSQGVPCTLTAQDIESATPEFCPVLGFKLERLANPKGGVADNTPTVDRLIPEIGYVRENIIVVSHKANRIKNNATVEELEAVTHFYKNLFVAKEMRAKNDS